MSRGLTVGIVATALLGLLASACSPSRTSAAGPTLCPTSAPAPRNVPVIYADYGHPAELSEAQLRRILKMAEPKRPNGRTVWFILVDANRAGAEPTNCFRATVYFSPDQSNRDLRRGRCLFVSSALELAGPRFQPELSEYVQVSPAGQPFGAELEVPRLPDLPFDPPTNGSTTKPADIATDELVRLVRFARSARVAGDRADGSLAERSRTEPILSIRVLDDGFEVRTGWVSGPLAGGGCILRIQKTQDGYRLTEVAMWVA